MVLAGGGGRGDSITSDCPYMPTQQFLYL
jgi:hypothetical protein